MKRLGDKIRDAISEKFGSPDHRDKTAAMEKAAKLLGMSRANLYIKLNAAVIPVDLLKNIENILEIKLKSLQEDEGGESDRQDTSVYTIPIKNKRRAKLVMPADADGEDVKLIIKHLNLFETHL